MGLSGVTQSVGFGWWNADPCRSENRCQLANSTSRNRIHEAPDSRIPQVGPNLPSSRYRPASPLQFSLTSFMDTGALGFPRMDFTCVANWREALVQTGFPVQGFDYRRPQEFIPYATDYGVDRTGPATMHAVVARTRRTSARKMVTKALINSYSSVVSSC
ncbi:hypothetical protein LZ30DRAFT_730913 [Colletotrichum cereale]|nr:hypothetical protein LZ30DRAFT_730913 [Colletotrichum cereale]